MGSSIRHVPPLSTIRACAQPPSTQSAAQLITPSFPPNPSPRSFRATSGCVMLPCAHIYHSDCLLRWYQTGKADDGACPICRRSFLPAQPAAERHAPTVAGETELASAVVVVASDAGEMEPAAVAATEEAMPASQPPLATGTSFTANVSARPRSPWWLWGAGGRVGWWHRGGSRVGCAQMSGEAAAHAPAADPSLSVLHRCNSIR